MTENRILKILGVMLDATGHGEKFISAVGALIAIASTMAISLYVVGAEGGAMLVASMGASAVLLFAVPHGALSQPWPLVGGNLVSALVGVTCAKLFGNPFVAGPLAVSLAIFAMHHLRCIHPPGGATALVAVVGGSGVHALGYQYVLTPVLLNVSIMLLVALAVNYPFPWRRYPASFRKTTPENVVRQVANPELLGTADFSYALREIGSYVDITEADLEKIYRLARKHALRTSPVDEELAVGNYYSNGEQAGQLSVRKVTELEGDTVSYRIVAGDGEGDTGAMSQAGFLIWQRYEVIPVDGEWHRIMPL